MNFHFQKIDGDSIEEYKKLLTSCIDKAIHLPFKNVLINGEKPQKNNCHYNAQTFEDQNSKFTCAHGWLVIDGGENSNSIFLLAHSVIRGYDDVLYEITPIESLDPRPFLESQLSVSDYYKLHEHLSSNSTNVTLKIVK